MIGHIRNYRWMKTQHLLRLAAGPYLRLRIKILLLSSVILVVLFPFVLLRILCIAMEWIGAVLERLSEKLFGVVDKIVYWLTERIPGLSYVTAQITYLDARDNRFRRATQKFGRYLRHKEFCILKYGNYNHKVDKF